MKLDKDKRFNEPGFIIQLACVRPKMYNKYIKHTMIGKMWGFSDWYPAYALTNPQAGIKKLTTLDALFDPLWNGAEGSAGLLYDVRDLLSHGEQFVNDTAPAHPLPMHTGMSGLAASDPALMRGEYCDDQAIQDLFVGTSASSEKCVYEGITSLTIAGHVTDTTPI